MSLSKLKIESQRGVSRRTAMGGMLGAAAGGLCLNGFAPYGWTNPVTAPKKRLLVIVHSGGLSQLESWDPKPGAPTGGPSLAISTSVPGTQVSELLPHTSQQIHHLTLLRSLDTKEDNHGPGRYLMLSGRREGSGLVYPTLPCVASSFLTPPSHPLPGYFSIGGAGREAAFLGTRYDPVNVPGDKPLANLARSPNLSETSEKRRQALRQKLNDRFTANQRGVSDTSAYSQSFMQAQQLMQHNTLFDLSQESPQDIERYGKHRMGQRCLLARRLLERGATCVQVAHEGYDSHAENFNFHLDLLEQFDRPFACLISDLAQRGILHNTIVLALGEFGRTPNINQRMGRDHWSRAWSIAMAGPGIGKGRIFGKTNDLGTEVTEDPVNAADLYHTFLDLLDIDSTQKYTIDGHEDIPIADPAGKIVEKLIV